MINIPKSRLVDILDTEPRDIGHPSYRLKEVWNTGWTFDSGLEEDWQAVFIWEDGKTYQVRYRKANPLYGKPEFGPFDHVQGDTVACQEVQT